MSKKSPNIDVKTTTDTQEVENNTIAKNDSHLEENPLSNDLSQKSIEEEPKVKCFKNPEYIDYIKTTIDKNYTVQEVKANTHFHQFDQLLANALLSSYPSLTDNKHILEDGIFLDSIPSYIRHDKDELDFSIFRKDGVIKGSNENSQVLQPFLAVPSDEQEYYNTISA